MLAIFFILNLPSNFWTASIQYFLFCSWFLESFFPPLVGSRLIHLASCSLNPLHCSFVSLSLPLTVYISVSSPACQRYCHCVWTHTCMWQEQMTTFVTTGALRAVLIQGLTKEKSTWQSAGAQDPICSTGGFKSLSLHTFALTTSHTYTTLHIHKTIGVANQPLDHAC